jgi:hypothetical protein
LNSLSIKIIIAAHKKYWMPTDPVYLPVHVGAEGKASIGYTPDNTGDNISSKKKCIFVSWRIFVGIGKY